MNSSKLLKSVGIMLIVIIALFFFSWKAVIGLIIGYVFGAHHVAVTFNITKDNAAMKLVQSKLRI